MDKISNDLLHAYFREIAKNLSKHNGLDYKDAISETNSKFLHLGFAEKKIREFEEEIGDPKSLFPIKAIINPKFLKHKLGIKSCFFVCDAREGRYPLLQGITDKHKEFSSRYIVYGPEDSIIQVYGIEDEFQQTFKELKDAGLSVYDLMVEDTIYYKGYPITDWEESDQGFSVQELNYLVEDFYSSGKDEIKKQYIKRGIILGGFLVENFNITQRIQALVGLNLRGRPSSETHANLITWFLQDEVISSVIKSFYSCSRGAYNYLIEIICDNPSQLDKVTDKFNEILKDKGRDLNAETSTYIYAKSFEIIPKFLGGDVSEPLKYTDTSDAAYLLEIKKKYIEPLAKSIHSKYAELEESQRIDLLVFLYETDKKLLAVKKEPEKKLVEALKLFAEGRILKSEDRLTSCLQPLIHEVEKTTKQATNKLLNLFFKGNKYAIKQLAGIHDKQFADWTLGEYRATFEKINKNDLYELVDMHFEGEFLQSFSDFTTMRNNIVHGRRDKKWDNSSIMINDIENTFRRGIYIIMYLHKNIMNKDFMVPPEKLLFYQEKKDSSNDLLKEIRSVGFKVEIIEKKLNELDPSIKDLFTQVLIGIKVVEIEAKKGHKGVKEALDTIIQNNEKILENVTPEEKNKVQKILGFITESTKEVTWNTLANIIAQILISISPDYAQNFLSIIKNSIG